jgi:hypothetical protein
MASARVHIEGFSWIVIRTVLAAARVGDVGEKADWTTESRRDTSKGFCVWGGWVGGVGEMVCW